MTNPAPVLPHHSYNAETGNTIRGPPIDSTQVGEDSAELAEVDEAVSMAPSVSLDR